MVDPDSQPEPAPDGDVLLAAHVDSSAPVERVALDAGSWVDVIRGWVTEPAEVYQALLDGVDWRTSQLFRYDHWVEERRLGSFWRPGTPLAHPVLKEAHRALQRRYKAQFNGFGMLHYRDGRDGQAFHRDTDIRWLDETVIAVLTFGARRPWLLRPRANRYEHTEHRGATHDLQPGPGDLIVMGGRCQADWEHSVPYLGGRPLAPRISIQWRYAWRTGKPFVGASYRAPLSYSHRR